jgi:hypothetical protein
LSEPLPEPLASEQSTVDATSEPEVLPDHMTIDYVKSNAFRVIHMDGAWGGVTPQLRLQMAVYSERGAIPRRVVHATTPEGTLGEETHKEVRADIVREVEADIIMDLSVAIALREWLDTRIKVLQQTIREQRTAVEKQRQKIEAE